MATIAANLQAVRDRIAHAASIAGRAASDITLVAVSKTFPAEKVAEACAAGQRAFGENYVQEAVEKNTRLSHLEWHVAPAHQENDRARGDAPRPSAGVASPEGPLLRPLEWHVAHAHHKDDNTPSDMPRPSAGVASPEGPLLRPLEWHVAHAHHKDDNTPSDMPRPSAGVASPEGPLLRPLEWHFIGPVQSNKTRIIAGHFDWVHGIEREKIAVRLNEARPANLPPLNVCIQINVSGEGSKSGIMPGEELALARAITALPRLRLRGLMAIPEPTSDTKLQRRRFALLREIRDKLIAAGIPLDTLSMGMSDDLEAAIAEGATMVRVGTAIFGQRPKN